MRRPYAAWALSGVCCVALGCEREPISDEADGLERYDSGVWGGEVGPFDAAVPQFPFSFDDSGLPFRGMLGGRPSRLSELRTAAHSPPPISGGTLALSPDHKLVVAADPDRDVVNIINPLTLANLKVQLPADSEPGRAVVDVHGAAHVVLRAAGKLARIELASGTVSATTDVCTYPRGLDYDRKADQVVVACMDGQVVTLAASDHAERARVFTDEDLRDVLITSGGELRVSRYRSAELLRVDGVRVMTRTRPLQVNRGLLSPLGGQSLSPTLAWRTRLAAGDGVWMLHQQSLDQEVTLGPGGYSRDCSSIIVQGAVTKFSADGKQVKSLPIAIQGTSVDLSVTPDEQIVAVASPGAYLRASGSLQLYATNTPGGAACPSSAGVAGQGNQVIAVAFADDKTLYALSREPSELEIFEVERTESPVQLDAGVPHDVLSVLGIRPFTLHRIATIALDRRSARDTGHDMFHADVNAGLACATCHGEVLDDGHVWNFANIGPRRTQTMRGGFLATAPFHWDGDMMNFRHLVSEVMTSRMSGFVVEDSYANAMAGWIDRQPALRLPPQDAAAVSRGKALFDSTEVGCRSCHSGEAFTNNQHADVGTGGSFQVPSLRGLALHPPFMHDGCAASLRDRFEEGCGGGDRHGNTSGLTEAQIEDLVAYLHTL